MRMPGSSLRSAGRGLCAAAAPRRHAELLQDLLQRHVGAAAHAGAHVRQVRQVLEVGAARREAAPRTCGAQSAWARLKD